MSLRKRLAVAFITSILSIGAVPAFASEYVEGTDAAAEIFDPLNVIGIHLELSPSSQVSLWNAPKEYVAGGMRIQTSGAYSITFPVEIRLKGGLGSLRNLHQKAGFKIKIPKEHRELTGGLKKLTLNNMVQDGSFVHEALSYRVFRAMGVAAPRVGYANVRVNGALYGLYANVETVDDLMLSRWFDSTKHLYEGSYWMDVWPNNEGAFEVDEGDPLDRLNLKNLTLINNLSGDSWFEAFKARTDWQQLLTMWATEIYIGHWDGYAHTIKNNYYLHADVLDKFSMLPWGTDQTWADYLDFYDPYDRGIMFVKCMEVPACKFEYQRKIFQVNKTAASLNLAAMSDAIESVLTPHISADPRKEVWTEDSYWHRINTKSFILNRNFQVNDMFAGYEPSLVVPVRKTTKKLHQIRWQPSVSSFFAVSNYEIQIQHKANKVLSKKTSATAISIKRQPFQQKIRIRAVNAFTEGEWSSWLVVPRTKAKR